MWPQSRPYTVQVSSAPTSPSAPLHQLLRHTAEAVQAVRKGRSLTDALARCPADMRPGTQALSFAVLRRLGAADALRQLLAPKRPQPQIEGLLLCALALLWPEDAPAYTDHTLVDQTVQAARKALSASAGFVNAVLRRFLREREALVAQVNADPVARFNHSAWWIEQLKKDWPEQWQAMLNANNQHPPMTLRAREGANAYLERLTAAGIAGRVVGPQAVVLERAQPVGQLPGFGEGEVSVQDLAAQLAAPLLLADVPQGARVLDACSAPGGKTAHLLELRPDLDLLALDSDAERLKRVQGNLDRMRLNAKLLAADARNTAAWFDGRPFDAILLDAPCSASGIVRRHPDVRWLRRPTDIAALAMIQSELLSALWPLLKPGGRLVYATCSVFKAEGAHQIDAFLQRQGDVQALDVPGVTGHLLPLADNDRTAGSAGPSVLDGFYYALLLKSAQF